MKIIALFVGTCVCLSGCVNLTEADEKCGPEKNWRSNLTIRDGGLNGTQRKVLMDTETEPEDICTVEHIKPSFLIYRQPDVVIPETMRFTASASVPLFSPTTEYMLART